jgi:Transposase DDE domain group 1
MMRRGSAGSNTTADHLQVLGDAIAALPPKFRRWLMVTADGAGASHGLITRLDQLGARERAAIPLVPQQAWQIAIGQRGEVRERRTAAACADRHCGHARCWVEEAHVTELTALLREGPQGDQMDGWPAPMRVFARRERPHPGAQLSLFEAQDGWRYSLWVPNVQPGLRGWRAQLGYIDATHRVHARVEDGIRTGKDCGIGRFPSRDFAMNSAWLAAALIAATLLSWLKLIALGGDLARAEPKTLPGPACRRETGPRRPPPAAENPRHLALGRGHRHRLGPGHRPATRALTSEKPPLRRRRSNPRGLWNPRPPVGQPGHRHTPTLKSRTVQRLSRRPGPVIRRHESSGLVSEDAARKARLPCGPCLLAAIVPVRKAAVICPPQGLSGVVPAAPSVRRFGRGPRRRVRWWPLVRVRRGPGCSCLPPLRKMSALCCGRHSTTSGMVRARSFLQFTRRCLDSATSSTHLERRTARPSWESPLSSAKEKTLSCLGRRFGRS